VKMSRNGEAVELMAKDGMLIVKDRGPGLSEAMLERLNDPMNRERYSETGGAGLGVSLCHRIAAEHNARLSFENRSGGGTIAKVKFFTIS